MSSQEPHAITATSTLVHLDLGPELIGLCISYFLFGTLAVQIFNYVTFFPKDRIALKVTVFGVFFFESLLIIVTTRISYARLCLGWGNAAALIELGWVDHCIPLLSGIVSGWAQLFYAWRIYVLGRKTKFWTCICLGIVPLMLLSTTTSLISAFTGMFTDKTIHDLVKARRYIVMWLVSSAVCDFINATCMVIVIQESRKRIRVAGRMGNVNTERRLDIAVRYSIESGALTISCTLVKLIWYFTLPNSRFFPMMGYIISKLYSNSMTASLNARANNKNTTGINFCDPSTVGHSSGYNGQSTFPVTMLSSKTQHTGRTVVVKETTIDIKDDIPMDGFKQDLAEA